MLIEIKWGSTSLGTVNYNKANSSATITVDISQWPTVKNTVRCYMSYDGQRTVNILPFKKYQNIVKVAMIVESPHKDEFDGNFNPLVPLNGLSGKRFDNAITSKMSSWITSSQYNGTPATLEIKIFNPVQYQTSLHHLLNNKIPFHNPKVNIAQYGLDATLRNDVWRLLYENQLTGCKSTFISDLTTYSPHLIINCCTGKKYKNMPYWESLPQIKELKNKELKTKVRNTIKNARLTNLQKPNYIEDSHPIAW